MQNLLTHRNINLVGFFACLFMMLYALYAQEFLGLLPCPLCVLQRMAVLMLGLFFLLLALQSPGQAGWYFYTIMIILTASAGMAVAGRHIWLQSLPPDEVPSCGPGLGFMLDAFPLVETLEMVFSGSGECAEISWFFLGLSMPAWVFIGLLGLSIYAIWGNLTSIR
jgi:protein dithiol:quinone oxidoreductase